MSVAIVVLLLIGFSLCVAVGLLTVLQNLINPHLNDDPGQIHHQGPMFHDYGAEQKRR